MEKKRLSLEKKEGWNFFKEMDHLFDRLFGREDKFLTWKNLSFEQPSLDLNDQKKNIEMSVDLPGIEKEDIHVKLEGEKIEIKAERKMKSETKGKNFSRQERSYKGFYRAFTLPAAVNPDKAKAQFKNGVLKIILPKVKVLQKKEKILTIN